MLQALIRQLRRGQAPRRPAPRRLHLGCGRDILEGWLNLDSRPGPGVEVVADLDGCGATPLPFAADSFDEFFGRHVIEHVRDVLALMQELHRVAAQGATAVFHVPYGSSDDADEDPTHVRRCFPNSFHYFAQPAYHRADYGYRGDWRLERLTFLLEAARHASKDRAQLLEEIRTLRNVVQELVVTLVAVKPARAPGTGQIEPPQVEFRFVNVVSSAP